MRYGTLLLVAMLLLASASPGCSTVLRSIIGSRSDADVPDDKDFDRILSHDLTEYMTDKSDKDIKVTYEMLRDGPTQSGVALPKFYIWIEKRSVDGTLMEDAAARIAAVGKTHFDIVQYYDRERIKKEPDLIKQVFPAEVAEKIFKKVGLNE
jgi:cyclopropane fatty-acyl-phospholipid synthase-like methyltransferase